MNAFSNALRQLDTAVKKIHVDPAILGALRRPEHVYEFKIPVHVDSGEQKSFQGYRVQYSSIRGPYKGGIRFHPHVDIDEVTALAFWMTIKTAVINIPLGGGKGGVCVDPKQLSQNELEQLSRGWVRAFCEYIGPHTDIPAPDVNTNAQIMDWMADEYEQLTGDTTNASFTGKSLAHGGSEGRDSATAQGGFYVLQELVEKFRMEPEETSMVIQGFGNAGYNFALLAHKTGYKIVGVSDSRGGIYNAHGFDPKAVMKVKEDTGSVMNFSGAKKVSGNDILTQECAILVPAALENQITKDNAFDIKAKAVIELANGPTTPDADTILAGRDIKVVPDVLANAGGVTVSYFEWEQNLAGEKWSEQEVLEKLKPIMTHAFQAVWQASQKHGTDLRTAAYIVALERLG